MKIEKQAVATWTEVGQWYKGPGAPNGSCPGATERRVTEREVYLADFYGNGAKLYLDSTTRLQIQYPGHIGGGVITNSSSDGHEGRIREVASRVGITV